VKRRQLISGIMAGVGFTATSGLAWQQLADAGPIPPLFPADPGDPIPFDPPSDQEIVSVFEQTNGFEQLVDQLEQALPGPLQDWQAGQLPRRDKVAGQAVAAKSAKPLKPTLQHKLLTATPAPQHAHARVNKVQNFERKFSDDVFLSSADKPVMQSVLLRLVRLQRLVGHGKFNILGFDSALRFAARYNQVGAFSPVELQYMEKLFETRASDYGFYGAKVTAQLTDTVISKDLVKVPRSGHYLLRDTSLAYYKKLTKDVGSNIILTSGIRSNIKQMYLFLNKAAASDYNLSKASRSLAPPGHSFHGIGDFDVGRVDWGVKNFSSEFASTDEFKRMQDLGYVQIRYTADNKLGVRYEPWHIKVV